jgi:hypothetical protein
VLSALRWSCRGALVRRFSCRWQRVRLPVVLVVMAGSVACCARAVLSQFAAVVLLVRVGTHGTDWFGLWSMHFPPMALHTVCTRNSYSTTSAISASSFFQFDHRLFPSSPHTPVACSVLCCFSRLPRPPTPVACECARVVKLILRTVDCAPP